MRDYLYVWNSPAERFAVFSGLEFRDIAGCLGTQGGLILVESGVTPGDDGTEWDSRTGFPYVRDSGICRLAKRDIYSWGDFVWADYVGEDFPAVPDQEIAELLLFSHMKRPLGRWRLPSLANRYLCQIHDDGWFLRMYYTSWDDIAALIGPLYPNLNLQDVQEGKVAYWLSGGSVDTEEPSLYPDPILNRRLRSR